MVNLPYIFASDLTPLYTSRRRSTRRVPRETHCHSILLSFGSFFPSHGSPGDSPPLRLAKVLLLFLSLIFYAWWNPWYVLLLVGPTAIDYIAGNKIFTAEIKRPKRIWLARCNHFELINPCVFQIRRIHSQQRRVHRALAGLESIDPAIELGDPAGNLILHLSSDELLPRYLPWRPHARQKLRQLSAVHLFLSPSGRRPHRPRPRTAAAIRPTPAGSLPPLFKEAFISSSGAFL